MILISKPIQFQWDTGNTEKNVEKHQVNNGECEEVFFDRHKKILKDVLHSGIEPRYIIFGKTKKGRKLFLVFTIRKLQVRVISARDLNKKEVKLYLV